MCVSRRHFAPGQSLFITPGVYRRTRLVESRRLRSSFVEVLRQFRQETGFLLIAHSQSFALRQRAPLCVTPAKAGVHLPGRAFLPPWRDGNDVLMRNGPHSVRKESGK